MKTFLLAIFVLVSLPLHGQSREICVTIDDLPVAGGDRDDIRFQQSVTDDLMRALTRHHVPAIGFVNESKLYTHDTIDVRKVNLLERWLENGMDLGNHTFQHKDYNAATYAEMAEDVVRGEPTVSRLLRQKNKSLKYLRQPYLHRGNTKEKVDSLAAFIQRRGYIEAPVTIDNGDWIYAAAYYKAWTLHDSVQMTALGTGYVDYMEKKVKYYEGRCAELFGSPVKQILLIHASRLNADWFDALARMLERNQYEFIPLARALTDPAYRSADRFYRNGGISWLDRWALTAGKKKEFFKDEPRVPDEVMKAAGVDSE